MILKNLAYDCLHRLDLFPLPTSPKKLDAYLEKTRNDGNAISQAAPWVAQAKLVGPEYCAAFIIRNGALNLITLSKSSASQLRFEHIENTKVNIWLEQFVTRINDLVKVKSKTDLKRRRGILMSCLTSISYVVITYHLRILSSSYFIIFKLYHLLIFAIKITNFSDVLL